MHHIVYWFHEGYVHELLDENVCYLFIHSMKCVSIVLFLCLTLKYVHLWESSEDSYMSDNKKTEYSYASGERNRTILEVLDRRIYDFITHPKNGTSDEIINDYKQILSSMKTAAAERMDDMIKKWDEQLHLSSQIIFNMGGPSFIRLQMQEIIDKLKDVYKFNDNVIKTLVDLHEKAVDAWELLRKAVLFY